MADKPDETGVAEKDDQSEEGKDKEQQDKPPGKRRLSPKKLLMIGSPVLLLLGGGAWFGRDYVPFTVTGDTAQTAQKKLYYDLPEMVVNLSSQGERAQYLKLKVALEVPNRKTLEALTPIMPRVLDMFQLYLRELRSSDLEGSAGIYRLKEELLRRINLEVHPHQINRVLFKEIIVQ